MTISPDAKLEILANPDDLARQVADWLLEKAVKTAGTFAVALSGGTTPRQLYERLARASYRDTFPWSRTHWFWGDERFVPHDHPDSNYGMTRDALLARAPVPSGNIHAVPTEGLTPEQAAARYEQMLHDFYGAARLDPARPLFDVVLLGIGDDGHTASLFPGQPALDQTGRWAVAVIGAKTEARITLTFPVLDSARDAVFLAVGENKRDVVRRARAGDRALPSARIRPLGTLHWFIDRAAAAR